MQLRRTNTGSAIICAVCTIFILSLIGATVLLNCAARYNVATKQVKAWKEALYAADGGGDIVAELFKPLPSMVVAHYLGVPEEDRKQFDGWTEAIVAANTVEGGVAGALGSLGDAVGEGQPDSYRFDPGDTRGPEVDAEARAAGDSLVDVLAEIHSVDVDAVGLGDLGRREGVQVAGAATGQRRHNALVVAETVTESRRTHPVPTGIGCNRS